MTVEDPEGRETREGPLLVFAIFLGFGIRAFGGPVAQIGGLLDEFVRRRRWLDEERFVRALGVYQLLPGPEAHEMCCYLGTVRAGRLGGIAAGLGFMLPGFLLMLAASALYRTLPLGTPAVAGAMTAMQIVACALVMRAVPALVTPVWRAASDTNRAPMAIVLLASLASISLMGAAGLPPSPDTIATMAPREPSALFGHGLVAGTVSFGGAYTALPYVASVASGEEGWMTGEACLDGVAIASVLPAPLVIFGTFVGYQGGGLPGAIAFTVGIFLPAFAFTFVGFGLFERLVGWRPARRALDLLGAAAVGLVIGAAVHFFAETCGGWPKRPTFFGAATAPLIGLAFVLLYGLRRLPASGAIVVATSAVLGGAYGALVR